MEKIRRSGDPTWRRSALGAVGFLCLAACTSTWEGVSKDASKIFGSDDEDTAEEVAKAGRAAPKAKPTPSNVYEVQKLLDQQGYDPGAVDGVFGERTARAIRSYQQNNDMKVTGRISADLLERLRKSARDESAGASE
jgi:peptidoglycan hydrolase-like protein with peptidoglycan-binding domain